MMKYLRSIIILIVVIGTAAFATWQHIRLKQLTVESAALRHQLAQALTKPEQPSMARVPSTSGQRGGEAPSSELLRLRGQVGMLREQLASAAASNAATAADTPARAPVASSSSPAMAEANLRKAEEEAELASQKVSALMASLNLPQDASDDIAASSVSDADLMSYRQAKQDAQKKSRFVQLLRLKVAASRALNGEPPSAGTAR